MVCGMSRIDQIFGQLRAEGRKALMPFVTAGYPSIEHTAAILPALERGGASICELGMPFSDPIADGPVIQASMTEALGGGFKPRQALDMIAAQRASCGLGVVAMVSYSIVYRIGASRFVEDAAKAGVDGFIFPDLPLEEAGAMAAISREAGLSCSLLIAPTTPPDRAAKIAATSIGSPTRTQIALRNAAGGLLVLVMQAQGHGLQVPHSQSQYLQGQPCHAAMRCPTYGPPDRRRPVQLLLRNLEFGIQFNWHYSNK